MPRDVTDADVKEIAAVMWKTPLFDEDWRVALQRILDRHLAAPQRPPEVTTTLDELTRMVDEATSAEYAQGRLHGEAYAKGEAMPGDNAKSWEARTALLTRIAALIADRDDSTMRFEMEMEDHDRWQRRAVRLEEALKLDPITAQDVIGALEEWRGWRAGERTTESERVEHVRAYLNKRIASRASRREPAVTTTLDAGVIRGLRCQRSGNLCGTDTWGNGSECACVPCQMWLRQDREAAASRREGTRDEDEAQAYRLLLHFEQSVQWLNERTRITMLRNAVARLASRARAADEATSRLPVENRDSGITPLTFHEIELLKRAKDACIWSRQMEVAGAVERAINILDGIEFHEALRARAALRATVRAGLEDRHRMTAAPTDEEAKRAYDTVWASQDAHFKRIHERILRDVLQEFIARRTRSGSAPNDGGKNGGG